MTRNRRRVFWPTLLIALLVFMALTFVAFGRLRDSTPADSKINTSQTGTDRATVKRSSYVRRSSFSPKLVWYLNALGDRLERPGKERLSVTGTLSRANDSETEIVAVFEFPERLHLTMQKGNQSRVITSDGEQTRSGGNSLDTAEQDLIETLVYGSAEHFFNTQMQGQATRFLGSRFRVDDGSNSDYNGPYFDIYKIADRVDAAGEERATKLYYFNSETLLLERMTYIANRNGTEINTETRLSDWRVEDGQKVARRIERLENGKSVFVLNIRSAQFGRRADDGIFQQ